MTEDELLQQTGQNSYKAIEALRKQAEELKKHKKANPIIVGGSSSQPTPTPAPEEIIPNQNAIPILPYIPGTLKQQPTPIPAPKNKGAAKKKGRLLQS